MTVLPLQGKVPVRFQRDAGGERHERHVEVRDDDDAKQDLASPACAFKGEEVDI